MLRTVLKTIHVPTMDFFFDRIQADQIPDPVLFFWECFNAIIMGNMFHFYDGATRKLVVRTHEAWRASLSHTVHFSESTDGRVLKLDRRGMPYQDQDRIRRDFRHSGRVLSEALAALLKHIREEYAEIDLTQTNACALDAYLKSEAAAEELQEMTAMVATSTQRSGGTRTAYLHAMNTAIDGTRLQRFDGSGPVTITSAYVSSSSATGTVTIYYAGPNGAVDDVDVSSANANILGVPLGVIADPIGVVPDCVTILPLNDDPNFPSPGTPGGASCTNTPIAITYTVKVKASAISGSTRPGTYTTGGSPPISIAEVFTTIASALSAYCLSTGIGGLEHEAGAGVVYTSELENAIRNASTGLYAVSVSLPASATTPIALGCIATIGTITGTLVVVAG